MWLIDKSAGPAINFVAVFVEGPIGISHEDAEKWAREITQAFIKLSQIETPDRLKTLARIAETLSENDLKETMTFVEFLRRRGSFTNAISDDGISPKDRGVKPKNT